MKFSSLVGVVIGLLASAVAFAGSALAQQAGMSLPGAFSRPALAVGGAQSAWVKGYNSTARLIAGAEPDDGVPGGRRLVAGVEIRMGEGWKTYWRHPGDDGGLPPEFDWAGSRNLKSARVLYPAPERIKSLNGTSIGYHKAVVFPVQVEPADAALPVELALALEYGICREICVPAEAKIHLVIEPSLAVMPPDLAASLARVPRVMAGPESKVLRSAKAVLSGPAPSITFDVVAGERGDKVDLFVEAPDGLYLPVAAKSGAVAGGVQRFVIDLKGVEDTPKLQGKALQLTVAGAGTGTEFSWLVK